MPCTQQAVVAASGVGHRGGEPWNLARDCHQQIMDKYVTIMKSIEDWAFLRYNKLEREPVTQW
jgi:hypothetical protein